MTVHVCICFTGQHQTMKVPGRHFIQNLSGHNAIVNCLANDDNVMDPGVDNGYNFQRSQVIHLMNVSLFFFFLFINSNVKSMVSVQVRPGSMDSTAGVFVMAFDYSGSRLITVEATKT